MNFPIWTGEVVVVTNTSPFKVMMRPKLRWENGVETSVEDPKVKYAIQMTCQDAIAFSRKADATRVMAEKVRALKQAGWTVSGKSDAKICYRGEESLSILLTARTKR